MSQESWTPLPAPGGSKKASRKAVVLLAVVCVVGLLAAVGGVAMLAYLRDENRLFSMSSESMEPTLRTGDKVRTDKLGESESIERGWVVVLNDVNEGGERMDVIKRIVALPGETIEARDGNVYVDDRQLEESYLAPGTATTGLRKQTVPEDSYFVMGDNRANSFDSRVSGPILQADIKHHVVQIVQPSERRSDLP